MAAQTLELTNSHLGSRQKQALGKRAAANGTNVAEEIRNAVDAYLSASRQAISTCSTSPRDRPSATSRT